jgi:hypothetical protein
MKKNERRVHAADGGLLQELLLAKIVVRQFIK